MLSCYCVVVLLRYYAVVWLHEYTFALSSGWAVARLWLCGYAVVCCVILYSCDGMVT